MNQVRILITGANGQVGSALQAVYKKEEVIPLSRKDLDITSPTAVKKALEQHKPRLVINAAGYTHVDKAEMHEKEAFLINEEAAGIVADAAAQRQIPIVHFSSDYVFDGAKKKPYVESDRTNPLSVYGKSKLAGEKAVMRRNSRHYIVRTSWVYHPHGKNFLLTMLELSKKTDVVKVVDDQHGAPTYAPHLAEGTARLLAARLPFGVYHLAGKGETTWFALASALFQAMGLKTKVVPIKTAEFVRPAARPLYSVLGSEKSSALQLPRWEEGLSAFVQAVKPK